MSHLSRIGIAALRWLGATLLVVVLIVLVGGAVALAYSRGIEPGHFGAAVLLIALLGLLSLSGLRWVLIRLRILPEQVPSRDSKGADHSDLPVPSWPREDALARVSEHVTAGRVWRAKEILQGHVGTYPYDPALYEAYGSLLESMGDSVQAGRYLFLGGVGEGSAAVDLFLSRHRDPNDLIGTFPVRAKLRSFDAYPDSVRQHLERPGVRLRSKRPRPAPGFTAPWSWLDSAWVGVVGLLFVLALVAGFVWIVRSLVGAVGGL